MLSLQKKDLVQIGLNVIAALILLCSSGGQGSFWGFLTFNIISLAILGESLLSKDHTGVPVWVTKSITYVLLTIKFSSNVGVVKPGYIWMVTISIASLLISRHLIKKRAIALWGQNVAYMIGGVMYVMAILKTPSQFGLSHICFWGVNMASFLLLVREVIQEKKDRTNLIIPGWASVVCVIYMVLIYVVCL